MDNIPHEERLANKTFPEELSKARLCGVLWLPNSNSIKKKTECLCIVGEGEFVSRFGNFVAVRDLCHHKFVREIMYGDDEHDEHQVKDSSVSSSRPNII